MRREQQVDQTSELSPGNEQLTTIEAQARDGRCRAWLGAFGAHVLEVVSGVTEPFAEDITRRQLDESRELVPEREIRLNLPPQPE